MEKVLSKKKLGQNRGYSQLLKEVPLGKLSRREAHPKKEGLKLKSPRGPEGFPPGLNPSPRGLTPPLILPNSPFSGTRYSGFQLGQLNVGITLPWHL